MVTYGVEKGWPDMQTQFSFTEGNIFKQLVQFSAPIMLTNLLQTSYQLVDSLWIGNLLGASALGAVSISGAIVFTVLSFVIGMNNAALTILSQQKGRRDHAGLKRYLNAFVVMFTVMSVSLGVFGYLLSEALLGLLGTPASMMAEAKAYLQINFIGMLFLFGYNFISTVLRALGDSKTPLMFVMIAVLLNVVIDPLFIAGFKLGIEGAAIATILSQGSAFVIGLVYVLRKRLAPFDIPSKPAAKDIRLILKLGIPSGLQTSVISAGSAAIMSVVTQFGGAVVAGYGAAQRLDRLVMLPAQALGTAVNSMAGQNIGIRNWQRVSAVTKYTLIYNFLVMGVMGLCIFVFAEFGVKLFIDDPEAIAFGSKYLKIMAFFFPFLGVNFILNGVVRAAGAMYQVLVLNILSFWVLRFPLTSLFSHFYGDTGIAIGMGASFVVSCLFASLYYRYGKWRQKQLFAKSS